MAREPGAKQRRDSLRILSLLVRNNQPLEPPVSLLLETLESVSKSFGSDDVREASLGWRVDGLSEKSLEVSSEPFIEPEVTRSKRRGRARELERRSTRRDEIEVKRRRTHAHEEHPIRFPNHE